MRWDHALVAQLAEERGQQLEALGQLLAPRGGDLRRLARLADEAHDVAPARVQGRNRAVCVGDQALDRARLAAQDLQGLARLAQAGMRATQHLGEVVRAAGKTGAQLGENQAKALAVGQAHDAVHEVEGNGRRGLLDRHPPSLGEPLLPLAGLAVDEVLPDQRLRAHLAGRVLTQLAEARFAHLHVDHGLGRIGAGEPQVVDRSGPHARDPQVAALGEPEGVVELHLVGGARVIVAACAGEQGRDGHHGHHEGGDDGHALHGPGTARWDSAHWSTACSAAESTLLPSAAGASAPPGQRRNCPLSGSGP